jgi:hypothetical protein
MASTRSASKDHKQRSTTPLPDQTPTLNTLMLALDRFKFDIQSDLPDRLFLLLM